VTRTDVKIFYISGYSDTGSTNANLTGVMYMLDGFQSLGAQIVGYLFSDRFTFHRPRRFRLHPEIEIPLTTIPHRKVTGIYLAFDLIGFFLALIYRARGWHIYSRNARLARWLTRAGMKVIFEVHDLSPMSRAALKTCGGAQIFCINRYLETIVKNNFHCRNVTYLPDAAYANRARPSNRFGDGTHLVYVGSDNPGKGVDFLYRLAASRPDLTFHLFGKITARRQAENLRLHGFQNKSDIHAAMAAADILLAPFSENVFDNAGNEISRTMSPLKLFEYMASNRPFIAADLPFVREIVQHETHALLAAPDRIEAWQAAIDRLLQAPEQARNMAGKAKKLWQSQHSWEKRARRVIDHLPD
jgi:glycosyltransferase involved in cell wall biosynthesis